MGKHVPKGFKNRRPLLHNRLVTMELEVFLCQRIHKQMKTGTVEVGVLYSVLRQDNKERNWPVSGSSTRV
jgi:hypothetical protein